GFLVTGLLFPLTLPPETPLWLVAVGISFGVVIGKEVFGGTGMNIFNPALTARAFLFFGFPAYMSGDKVWIAGLQEKGAKLIDAFSGATPLAAVVEHSTQPANAGVSVVKALTDHHGQVGYSFMDMFLGRIPGAIGETSTLACLLGALLLLITGIASWRIMLGVVLGAGGLGFLLNLLAPSAGSYLALPWYYHFVMGGFAFGTVFMATDPVTAPQTRSGKLFYGLLIGIVVILVRVFNAGFMEGMMLAILFGNVFSSMIDYFIVQNFLKRRMKRVRA
ncbi:MAG: NADH:ubiquinone reductase (Na(+)-transporting) subunit B, partial [Lentisphaerae bacterium]